ncbi:MAG: hypothetical protein RR988_03075 [Clostridia bacterium]
MFSEAVFFTIMFVVLLKAFAFIGMIVLAIVGISFIDFFVGKRNEKK